MSIHAMLKLISGLAICAVLFMAIQIYLLKRKKPKRKKSKQRPEEQRKRLPESRHQDEVIYTTVRPNHQGKNDPNASLIRNAQDYYSARSSPLIDTLSITSNDIEALSHNPKFIRDPIGALKKAGANRAEIRALMSHPNFQNDPLAALKKPNETEQATSTLPSIRESRSSSIVDEPPLH